MKKALRESLWLPGMLLLGGLALMVMLLQAASGAALGGGPQASYPPPSSPCTYAPIIGINSGLRLEAQAAAAYPIAEADARLALQPDMSAEASAGYPPAGADDSQAHEAEIGAGAAQVSPAAYPPPSSLCALRNKFLYTPIIWNDAR